MLDREIATLKDVEAVASRVLEIERAILRRAMGVVYLLGAVVILVEGVFPVAVYDLGFSSVYTFWLVLTVNTVTSLSEIVAAVWIFRRVLALRIVRRAIRESFWAKTIRPLPALVGFALFYGALIAVLEFLTPDFYTILFGLEVAGIPMFYYGLKITFPEGLPVEGKASLLAYSIASIGVFATYSSIFVGDAFLYLLLWTGESIVFILAFVLSRSANRFEPQEATLDS
jgi:hypothetical protein